MELVGNNVKATTANKQIYLKENINIMEKDMENKILGQNKRFLILKTKQ